MRSDRIRSERGDVTITQFEVGNTVVMQSFCNRCHRVITRDRYELPNDGRMTAALCEEAHFKSLKASKNFYDHRCTADSVH